jgi:hypothetical protein
MSAAYDLMGGRLGATTDLPSDPVEANALRRFSHQGRQVLRPFGDCSALANFLPFGFTRPHFGEIYDHSSDADDHQLAGGVLPLKLC